MTSKTISHYRVLEKLGGGRKVVQKAQDIKLNRFVALKFLCERDPETTNEKHNSH